MLSLSDVQDLISQTFLDGNLALAGIIMFGFTILALFGLLRNAFLALLAGMVVALFFTVAGVLPTDLTILLIIVSVLGMAYTARNSWS